MSHYVMSDIHGDYASYRKMLEKIRFSDEDTLYIIGDVVDRGEQPIKILLDIMDRPNVIFLIGNHEAMFCECLNFLLKEVTEENIEKLDDDMMGALVNWMYNGADTTMKEFRSLPEGKRREVADYLMDSGVYEEVEVAGKEYILVHTGPKQSTPRKRIWEYELDELVWERPDYHASLFGGKYVIMGHTPTQLIEDAERPGYIYHCGKNTVIDCGCASSKGRLGCMRLEDGAEFYVEKNEA